MPLPALLPRMLLCSLALLLACSKGGGDGSSTAPTPPLLQTDPSVPAGFGKRLHLDQYGVLSDGGHFWGRNSTELFVSAPPSLLRIDLASQTVEVLAKQGVFTAKTNDNSAVLLSTREGYYTYDFATRRTDYLVNSTAQWSLERYPTVAVAGSHLFFLALEQQPPGDPCPLGYCLPLPSLPADTLYHINRLSGEKWLLGNKRFIVFAKDGGHSILYGSGRSMLYLYNNSSRAVTDSFASHYSIHEASLYYGTTLKYYAQDPQTAEVVIKNPLTQQELQRFSLMVDPFVAYRYHQNIGWSHDGSKLFYTGTCTQGGCPNTTYLNLYDLATGQEQVLIKFDGGTNRVFRSVKLSEDNKRLFFLHNGKAYVKDL